MRKITLGNWSCSPRERELVNEVLDSGRLSYGEKSRELEARFAELHNSRFGVLSNSGTSSLHVAVQALKEYYGWEDWTKVLVPAITFVASVNVIIHNNLTPILVDVDPLTYNMSTDHLEKMLRYNRSVSGIMPVHLFGQPADMVGILQAAGDIPCIEDACETMFATIYDQPVGSWADVACFSFYMAHLVTAGVGGIGITDNPELAALMRSLVNHGRDGIYINIDDDNVDDTRLREVVSRRFNFERIGHSFRVTEMEAALALAQIDDEYRYNMLDCRQENAFELTALLADLDDRIQLPTVDNGNTHSWMMYPLVMRDEDKTGLVNHLEENGVETRDMMPILGQPAYEYYRNRYLWDLDEYPVAQWIDRCGFYLGCHQDLVEEDMAYVSELIHDWCREN